MNAYRPLRKYIIALVIAVAAVLASGLLLTGCGDGNGQEAGQTPSVGASPSSPGITASFPGATASSPLIDTIVVSGTGKVTTAPDKASIQISVENDGATAAEALDANSKDTQKVLQRLKAEGVTDEQIETAGVVVYPNRYYDSQSGQEKTTGYRAQNTITVEFKDLSVIGDVFAAMTEAGADSVSGPTWELSDDNAAITTALSKAIANARMKAEAIAADQGLRLGETLIISESSATNWYPLYSDLRATPETAGGSVTPPPIIPQNIEVTAAVTVTYRISR